MNHEQQARQFIAWHRKRGGDLDVDFGAWSRSKDLDHRDHVLIRCIVLREIAAHGTAPVDVADWMRPGAA